MITEINESKTLTKYISRFSIDVNLIVEHLTWDKCRTMIKANVNAKIQWHIAHVKKIMSGILVHDLGSVMKIVTRVNTWKIADTCTVLLMIL